MYSRSFSDEDSGLALPQNYDGTAFLDGQKSEKTHTRPPTNAENAVQADKTDTPSVSAIATSKFPFSSILGAGKNLFGGLFGGSFKLPKLGTEEILIIATALFLLFSKDGDKECAILLLLLLLIN